MKKKWLIIDKKGFAAGFILICAVLTWSGFMAGKAYLQPEVDALKIQVANQANEIRKLGLALDYIEEQLKSAELEKKDLQQRYLDLLDYSSNITAEKQQYYDNWQELLKHPVEVEKLVYQNIYSRQWESVEQFSEWYHAQKFTYLFPSGAYLIDCDDYAAWVQRQALEQGYQVSVALVWYGRLYNGQTVTDTYTAEQAGHAGCLVEIAGTYYYFEPKVTKFNGLVKVVSRD